MLMRKMQNLTVPIPATTQEISQCIHGELFRPIWLYDEESVMLYDAEQQREVQAKNDDGSLQFREVEVEYLLRCPTGREFRRLNERVWNALVDYVFVGDRCECGTQYAAIQEAVAKNQRGIAQLQFLLDHPDARALVDTEADLRQTLTDVQAETQKLTGMLSRWIIPPTPPAKLEKKVCSFCQKQIAVSFSVAFSDHGIFVPIAEILFDQSWTHLEPRLPLNAPKLIYTYLVEWLIGTPAGLPDFFGQFMTSCLSIFSLEQVMKIVRQYLPQSLQTASTPTSAPLSPPTTPA
jgi:hypothetical protein